MPVVKSHRRRIRRYGRDSIVRVKSHRRRKARKKKR